VIEATGAPIEWEEAGAQDAAASAARTRVALKGPSRPAARGPLREALGLYATVRPCRAHEGVRTRFPETDVVLVIRLSEDERARGAASEYAREHGRGEVTEIEEDGVAALASRLLCRPDEFDVITLPECHGDVFADLGAGLIGGRGVAPGFHLGTEGAVFEATHGCAPAYAGKDSLNPTGLMLSGALMLRHIDEQEAGDRLQAAIAGVIRRGEQVTFDVKPTRNDPSAVGTSQFADAVIEEMNK
jgi:isocitrate dehydrogenase